MPIRALPPDLFVAAGGDHLRCQAVIPFRVPLGGDLGRRGGEIIKPRKHAAIAAIGTAGRKGHTVIDDGTIAMPLRAEPPDLSIGVRRDGLRGECAVSLGMPLFRHHWGDTGQIVFAGDHGFSGADWASCPSVRSGLYSCLPEMSTAAPPPHLSVTGIAHVAGRERAVFRRVPLCEKSGNLPGITIFL